MAPGQSGHCDWSDGVQVAGVEVEVVLSRLRVAVGDHYTACSCSGRSSPLVYTCVLCHITGSIR